MPTTLNSPPRVALLTDTFYEANGVATLSRHLAEFSLARGIPFMVARGGSQTEVTQSGSLRTLVLKRGAASFPLDKSLYCDPFLARHKQLLIDELTAFKPDIVHITGPGDMGFMGLWVSHIIHVPLVASWHTNLHEYLARRMEGLLHLLPPSLSRRPISAVERQILRGLLRFYKTARFTLAPNEPMTNVLRASTGNPSYLMPHGVDLSGYSPTAKAGNDLPFCIGYVGRLTTEKNVRCFVDLERQLIAAGETNYKFLIVGEGGQQNWLRQNLQRAEITGVLRGPDLAAAYSRMDAFVFPSLTDTFGLVILEAMASGVPVVLSPETGARIGIEDAVSGFLSHDFAASIRQLIHNPPLRAEMGRAARAFANRHSWDSVFEQLYRTYEMGLDADRQRRNLREATVRH